MCSILIVYILQVTADHTTLELLFRHPESNRNARVSQHSLGLKYVLPFIDHHCF